VLLSLFALITIILLNMTRGQRLARGTSGAQSRLIEGHIGRAQVEIMTLLSIG